MLFQVVIEILRSYGASNQGMLSKSVQKYLMLSDTTKGKKRIHTQEEEADKPYADIGTALTLLTDIMASEFEDFSKGFSVICL